MKVMNLFSGRKTINATMSLIRSWFLDRPLRFGKTLTARARVIGCASVAVAYATTIAGAATVNVDFQFADQALHTGNAGVLSGTGTLWNQSPPAVIMSNPNDENGAGTSISIENQAAEIKVKHYAVNNLQDDSIAFYSGGYIIIRNLDPAKTYAIAFYASDSADIRFMDSNYATLHTRKTCTGGTSRALPGLNGYDYVLATGLVPTTGGSISNYVAGNSISGMHIAGLQIAVEVQSTVTFDGQGGTTPNPTSIIVTNGSPYGTLATTTRDGYSFGGWWTGASGTGKQVTSSTIATITAAQTLYAKWALANNPPTNILLSSTNVAENLPVGTTVGSFSTQDPDATNTFIYVLTNGADNSSFTISGSNLLTAASFNYEVQSNYSIRVQSTDQGVQSTQKVFTITVSDIDETPVILNPGGLTNGNMVLRWSSVTNHLYTVHYSTNLLTGFSVLQSNIPATPAINSYTQSVLTAPQKFWKISTVP